MCEIDPEWRVNAERRAHHGQLVAGSGAAAEGARTVPACHRGADARPGLGTRPLQPQDQPVKSPHTALTLGAEGGSVEPQTAALTSLQFVTRGGKQSGNCSDGRLSMPTRATSPQGSQRPGVALAVPLLSGPWQDAPHLSGTSRRQGARAGVSAEVFHILLML